MLLKHNHQPLLTIFLKKARERWILNLASLKVRTAWFCCTSLQYKKPDLGIKVRKAIPPPRSCWEHTTRLTVMLVLFLLHGPHLQRFETNSWSVYSIWWPRIRVPAELKGGGIGGAQLKNSLNAGGALLFPTGKKRASVESEKIHLAGIITIWLLSPQVRHTAKTSPPENRLS